MPTQPVTTWILVADGAKARLLERIGANAPLTPASAKCFSDPEARAPTRDIGADRPGRVQESANAARHAMEPRVDWHRYAKEQFAKSVAGALEEAALQKKYEALILVAPPQALGDLRRGQQFVFGRFGGHIGPIRWKPMGLCQKTLKLPLIDHKPHHRAVTC